MPEPMPSFLARFCPHCGSGDVRWCAISVRPYCNDCNTWGAVNYGTAADAAQRWNNRLMAAGLDNDTLIRRMVYARIAHGLRHASERIWSERGGIQFLDPLDVEAYADIVRRIDQLAESLQQKA